MTAAASERLFSLRPHRRKCSSCRMKRFSRPSIRWFYHTKVKAIREICRELIERFHSRVPETIDELLTLRGVGRKTANLVLSLGFGGDGICVDTHVHRISNRLGYLKTRNLQTETVLRGKTSPEVLGHLQHDPGGAWKTCLPSSFSLLSRFPVYSYCDRIGVSVNR